MKKLLCKKVKGFSNFITTIVCVLALTTLSTVLLCVSSNIHNRNEVERVHRKYLLAMEKDGYLTSTNLSLLSQELERLNCKDIYISGSLSPVGYGEIITLRIECSMKSYLVSFDMSSTGRMGEGYVNVVFEKTGTALY